MFGSLDISVSGMVAQRERLEVIASNLARRDAPVDPNADPDSFRRLVPIFAPGDPSAISALGRERGVHMADVALDQGEFSRRYDPEHPFAQPPGSADAGYVYYPNIDPVTEQVNAIEAMRGYEANMAAAEAAKTMLAQALRIIA